VWIFLTAALKHTFTSTDDVQVVDTTSERERERDEEAAQYPFGSCATQAKNKRNHTTTKRSPLSPPTRRKRRDVETTSERERERERDDEAAQYPFGSCATQASIMRKPHNDKT
jgi:hypothetical protein